MKVLIAGGAGFIGSNLCDDLIIDGHEVLCIDNLSTGKFDNIEKLMECPRFHFNKIDIIDWQSIYDAAYRFEPHQIYNLACPASPDKYQKMSIQTLETCFEGTRNLLRIASLFKIRMLHTSTSEVYGDPEISPQTEDYRGSVNCFGPRACYDEGKRVAESLIYEYNRIWETDCRIVRIFNTYGPRLSLNDGRVVSNFIKQALTNKPITVYGDGSQTRSLMYIDDLLSGFDVIMRLENNPGIVNLGNPVEINMLDLAKKVLDLIPNSKSEIVFKDLPIDDPKKRNPDISKAIKLGWTPVISLEKGLKRTIEYFNDYVNEEPIS